MVTEVEDEETDCISEASTVDNSVAAWPRKTGTADHTLANSRLMAEAVAPLVDEMVEKVRPVPAWNSLPAFGYTDSLWAIRKSIPKMAIWTSA
jgi:hypothetical protein